MSLWPSSTNNSLRLRRSQVMSSNGDTENNSSHTPLLSDESGSLLQKLNDLQHHNTVLESSITALRSQIEYLKAREKKLLTALQVSQDGSVVFNEEEAQVVNQNCPMEPQISFVKSLYDRGSWLIGLLVFQSFSSFIVRK